jgi:hypothetical protein
MKHLERRALIEQQLSNLPSSNEPRKSDGTAKFKLVGGKYHDIEIRVFAPWEPVEFPNGDRYVYSDVPFGRSKRHVYLLEQ